jgi:hypothetical protein
MLLMLPNEGNMVRAFGMFERRVICRVLVGKPEGKRRLERPRIKL